MSEIKGSLLTIVLTVAVFGIVFGIISASIKENSQTIASKMKSATETSAQVVDASKSHTLDYKF